jgi:cation diffusion facilitator family transporter
MIGTMGTNLFVSLYEGHEGRRLGSEYLIADAVHTRSDLYVSLGVIASFAGARAGLVWSDTAVAIAIAAVIAVQAVRILVRAFHVLTDRAALPAEGLALVASAVEGVRSVREVRTRGGGDAVYVDLIAHVDGHLSLQAAHDVADRIEAALQKAHPQIVDVVVHLEPA